MGWKAEGDLALRSRDWMGGDGTVDDGDSGILKKNESKATIGDCIFGLGL